MSKEEEKEKEKEYRSPNSHPCFSVRCPKVKKDH